MERFRLGITMAGAISAGAYSGGVFDMIFEVLEAWQNAKDAERNLPPNQRTVPTHDVIVPVISGASAGSITGALGLIALADAASGSPVRHKVPGVGTIETRLPRLYTAWVTRPRFIDKPPAPFLLGHDDLNSPAASLLDTTLLDRIAAEALAGVTSTRSRPYLSSNLHLFLTVTNLQGIPYRIDFAGIGVGEPYVMTCHADRVHFTLANLGTAHEPSIWADPDPPHRLDVGTLAVPGNPGNSADWCHYLDATLASSAFPIGLRARPLPPVPAADLEARHWPIRTDRTGADRFRLEPAWKAADISDPIPRGAVDGGVIDNEPFEYARWTLMAEPPEPNERCIRRTARAVIMIDPFPSEPVAPPADPDVFLLGVVRRFIPLLVSQARFKLDSVAAALDPKVGSRFLISPRRYTKHEDGTWNDTAERHGIACGLLGGFGGFLSEAMRAHDYQLGRLNAYRFLKYHFCFPRDNDVLKIGYAGLGDPEVFSGALSRAPNEPDPARYQMIPVLPTVHEPESPQWPRVSQREVDTFVTAAGARAKAVAIHAIGSGVGILFRFGLRDAIEVFIRRALMHELLLRNQFDSLPAAIDGKLKPSGRAVLAALADPRFGARTAAGIADELGQDLKEVNDTIKLLAPLLERGPVFETWRIAALHPGWLARQILGEGKIG